MEYKGIYYGDTNEQKFYEGGAHFSYIDLYNCLEKLCKKQQLNSYQSPNQVKLLIILMIKISLLKQEIKLQILFIIKLEIFLYIIILIQKKIIYL